MVNIKFFNIWWELPHLFLKIQKILLEKNKMHYQNLIVQI